MKIIVAIAVLFLASMSGPATQTVFSEDKLELSRGLKDQLQGLKISEEQRQKLLKDIEALNKERIEDAARAILGVPAVEEHESLKQRVMTLETRIVALEVIVKILQDKK